MFYSIFSDFNFAGEVEEKKKSRELPKMITVEDPQPGEARILSRRTFPSAIRFYKRNQSSDEHKFHFQELLLYCPFRDENEFHPDDAEKCREVYEEKKEWIELVKAQVMPYLKSTEEAQMLYEMTKDQEVNVEDVVGAQLDPEKEQENEEGDEGEDDENDEYMFIDPDGPVEGEVGEERAPRLFKTIEIPSRQNQIEEARKLDKMQKVVLSVGLKFAREVVKARKKKNKMPDPPLVIVHGGAGSGKSKVIESLAAMMEGILQQPGDSPECPHLVLCAFTGKGRKNDLWTPQC